MIKTMTNAQMLAALEVLAGAAQETGKLGYAIARNRRKITDAVTEYSRIRDELVTRYGMDNHDGTYQIASVDALKAIQDGLAPYADIAHDVEIMTVSPDDFTGGGLTSQQMFALDWMVSEDG